MQRKMAKAAEAAAAAAAAIEAREAEEAAAIATSRAEEARRREAIEVLALLWCRARWWPEHMSSRPRCIWQCVVSSVLHAAADLRCSAALEQVLP